MNDEVVHTGFFQWLTIYGQLDFQKNKIELNEKIN
tara:strand:- start:13059 stop:13163 length:105 start_codon:yes stop_codon:yes gene_type:complete